MFLEVLLQLPPLVGMAASRSGERRGEERSISLRHSLNVVSFASCNPWPASSAKKFGKCTLWPVAHMIRKSESILYRDAWQGAMAYSCWARGGWGCHGEPRGAAVFRGEVWDRGHRKPPTLSHCPGGREPHSSPSVNSVIYLSSPRPASSDFALSLDVKIQ